MNAKTAIITGASGGIGTAIARKLNLLGYNLVLNYRKNKDIVENLIKSFDNKETQNLIVKADISVFEEAKLLINEAIKEFNTIDVLVNNAGITKDNLILLMSEDDFDSVINTNLKGTFNCIKHVSKKMVKQKHGRIINISSVVALSGNAGQSNYCSSKAGIIGMTKSLAKELARKNILVNAVAPGFIETKMTSNLSDSVKSEMLKNIPLNKFGSPDDIANTVEFLVSKNSSYITGQVISVNGGLYM